MSDDHFGPVEVSYDHAGKRATLTLRRHADPLSDRVIAGLKRWAMSMIEADYPAYSVTDETGLSNGGD